MRTSVCFVIVGALIATVDRLDCPRTSAEVFFTRLLTTSGMRRPLLLAIIAALFYDAVGRPQPDKKQPPITRFSNMTKIQDKLLHSGVNFIPSIDMLGSKCDKSSTFCESPNYYPSDHIRKILKTEADNYKSYFGSDDIIPKSEQRTGLHYDIDLCPHVQHVIFPKVAKNKEDRLLFIVNEEPYMQGVSIEKCWKQGMDCKFSDSFPLGYRTNCHQKYVYRRLLALNEHGNTHTDSFLFPSCCSCNVKAVGLGKKLK